VVIDYAYTGSDKIPSVELDDYTASYEITKYLLSKGKKNIGVIGGFGDSIHEKIRYQGFESAMIDADIDFDRDNYIPAKWNRESGYEACKELFEKTTPDALFCFNDLMAAGAYDYLYEIGKVPGKDIAVVGFDNREISEYLNPPLTTMEIPLREIGHKGAEVMFKKIKNQKLDSKKIKVACKLIERKSV